MTQCTPIKAVFQAELFPSLKYRKIKVDFYGGNVSSVASQRNKLYVVTNLDGPLNIFMKNTG
jgi:hypothetical protein